VTVSDEFLTLFIPCIFTMQNQPNAHLLQFNLTNYLLHVSIPECP